MPDELFPKLVLYEEIEQGWRASGGQMKRYKDRLHATLKNVGIHGNWEELCKDRAKWRNIAQQNNGIFGQRNGTGPGNTQNTPIICPECGRGTGSRIGMVSHERMHRRPQ